MEEAQRLPVCGLCMRKDKLLVSERMALLGVLGGGGFPILSGTMRTSPGGGEEEGRALQELTWNCSCLFAVCSEAHLDHRESNPQFTCFKRYSDLYGISFLTAKYRPNTSI